MARKNDGRKIMIERKMDDAPLAVESMTNKYSDQRQIQINEHYLKEDGSSAYGRKTVNLNVVDIPAIVAALSELYEKETGKGIDYET